MATLNQFPRPLPREELVVVAVAGVVVVVVGEEEGEEEEEQEEEAVAVVGARVRRERRRLAPSWHSQCARLPRKHPLPLGYMWMSVVSYTLA